MTFFQAIFLGIVQGLTEFLPISSSGHLVIFQKLFNLEPPILFDILVHVGTLGAIIIFFKKHLIKITKGLVKKDKKDWQLVLMIILGTIPAIIAGLFLKNYLEQVFDSLLLVGLSLLVTGGLLISTKKIKKSNQKLNRLNYKNVLIIGCLQALSILPGISRSGSTIVGGLWQKIDRKNAFQFSFFLAIPTILGALILQIPELMNSQSDYLIHGILGMLVAGLVGFLALIVLKKVLLGKKLWLFGIYCLSIGMVLILIQGLSIIAW